MKTRLKAYLLALLVAGGLAAMAETERKIVTSGLGYFPVAVRLKNGDLLAVIRGGAAHIGVKGRLDLVRSTDSGQTWSPPWTVADTGLDDRNPALGQLKDGTLILAYVIASNYDDTGLQFKGSRTDRVFDGVYVIRSRDNGRTWSKPVRDPMIRKFYEGKGHVSPYGKIVQLADSTVLMAVYFDFFDSRGSESHLFRSKDGGNSWGEPVLLGSHYNETALAVLHDGRVLAAMRSEKGANLAITESSDSSRSWSKPVQVTGDDEHPADLIQLKDRRVLMVYGQRNAPRGVQAMLSPDGRTWDKSKRIVLAQDAPNRDCGYPSSVELADGKVVTLYYQVDDLKNAPQSSSARALRWSPPSP